MEGTAWTALLRLWDKPLFHEFTNSFGIKEWNPKSCQHCPLERYCLPLNFYVFLQVHFAQTEPTKDIYSLFISTLVVSPALNTEKNNNYVALNTDQNIDYGIIMATWKFSLQCYNWIFFQKSVSLLNTLNKKSPKPHLSVILIIRRPVKKGFNLITYMSGLGWRTFSIRWLVALVRCNMTTLVARDLA